MESGSSNAAEVVVVTWVVEMGRCSCQLKFQKGS